MTEIDIPNIDPQVAEKLHFWRWLDDDYIDQGKVSGLAILEIFAAMAFYWWIANYFELPWVLVLNICIAPILLLRSEASIHRGQELLARSSRDDYSNSFVMLCACIAVFSVNYIGSKWLTDAWFAESFSWLLFWQGVTVGVITTIIAATILVGFLGVGASMGAIAAASTHSSLDSFLFAVVIGSIGTVLGVVGTLAITETTLIFKILAIILALLGVLIGVLVGFYGLFFLLGFVIGLCFFGWVIRLRATLTHLQDGIEEFSNNWRESVLISDLRFAPALIPRAGKLHTDYNVAAIFRRDDKDTFEQLFLFFIALALTIIATLYRWNIKASALIWAPIALGLSPSIWPIDPDAPNAPSEKRRTDSTKWTNNWAIGSLGTFCLYLTGWVALTSYKLLNEDIQSALPDWTSTFYKYLSIPQPGLRLTLAILFLLSLIWLLKVAYGMHADYFEELNNSKAYEGMSPQVEKGFHAAAKRVARSRKITQMMGVLMIYAFLLTLAMTKLPNTTVFKYLRPIENLL